MAKRTPEFKTKLNYVRCQFGWDLIQGIRKYGEEEAQIVAARISKGEIPTLEEMEPLLVEKFRLETTGYSSQAFIRQTLATIMKMPE